MLLESGVSEFEAHIALCTAIELSLSLLLLGVSEFEAHIALCTAIELHDRL
jgi:uncharacterized small protein (DUF1192 family)